MVQLEAQLVGAGVEATQTEAILDGSTSLDEFAELRRREAACLSDAGMQTTPVSVIDGSPPIPVFQVVDDGTLTEEFVLNLSMDCYFIHTAVYERLYRQQHGPSVEEESLLFLEAVDAFVECASAAGTEVPGAPFNQTSVDSFMIWYTSLSPGSPLHDQCRFDPFE